MKVREFLSEDRAVSPVVGVALLIAITVILAAVIGAVVLGLGTSSADAPQASLAFEEHDEGNVTITHQSGQALDSDHVEVIDSEGEINEPLDLRAGQSKTLDADLSNTDEISVVWMDPNGNDESVIASYELEGE